jgi:hypothetical protein
LGACRPRASLVEYAPAGTAGRSTRGRLIRRVKTKGDRFGCGSAIRLSGWRDECVAGCINR